MKKIKLLLFVFLVLIFTGCTSRPQTTTDGKKWSDDWINIGRNIGVDAPKQLTLLDNKETLAADGLYYATWTDGNAAPYENSDGDTIDLYDAQLYFLASEASNEKAALEACNSWLTAAKENYEIISEHTVTCNGHSYALITYNCVGEDTPYARGVSAFGACGVNAVCVEFTCLENYEKDLEPILTKLLDGCHYRAD